MFCGVLFQLGDAAVQMVDIVGGSEAGLSPHLFAEMLGQALAELGVFAGQTDDAFMIGVGDDYANFSGPDAFWNALLDSDRRGPAGHVCGGCISAVFAVRA